MPVSYVPGSGEDIGRALASIGGLASQAINPNQELQRQIKEALVTNPKAISSIATAYRKNPEVLHGLVGKDIADRVLATPAGPDEILSNIDLSGLQDIMNDPKSIEAFKQFRTAGIAGTTPVGMATEIPLAQGIKDTLADKGKLTEAVANKFGLKTPVEKQREVLLGKLTDNAIRVANADGTATPDDKNSMRALFPGYFKDEDFDNQLKLWRAKDAIDFGQAQHNMYLQRALMKVDETGVGTTEEWYNVLTNEHGEASLAKTLAENPELIKTEKEQALAAIGQKLIEQPLQAKAVTIAKTNNEINLIQQVLDGGNDKVKLTTESEQANALNNINAKLDYLNVLGRPKYTATFEKTGSMPWNKKRVKYFDANGKEVSTDKIESTILDSPSTPSKAPLQGPEIEAFKRIVTLQGPERDKALAVLKSQAPPDSYSRIVAKLGVK